MPPRRRKLPSYSSGPWAYLVSLGEYVRRGEKPPPLFTIDDWEPIEGAYGEPLSADVRKELVAATEFFVVFKEWEQGERLTDVQTKINACKKRASEFQRALGSLDSGSASLFIAKNLNNAQQYALHVFLPSFNDACDAALKQLREYPATKEGDAWDSWVRRIGQIMRAAGLPCTVRKDAGNKSKSDRQSPFALLVWELQSCLPAECRRHVQSKGALADALSEVLSKTRGRKKNRGR
jgi:hypothetical protein